MFYLKPRHPPAQTLSHRQPESLLSPKSSPSNVIAAASPRNALPPTSYSSSNAIRATGFVASVLSPSSTWCRYPTQPSPSRKRWNDTHQLLRGVQGLFSFCQKQSTLSLPSAGFSIAAIY
ncbi:hypothetical protein SLA2020_116380 [Shorea laevis]